MTVLIIAVAVGAAVTLAALWLLVQAARVMAQLDEATKE